MKTLLLTMSIAAGLGLTAMDVAAQETAPRGLPDFATLDADGDGQITQAELAAQAEARFATIDTGSDGAVSAAELTAHMQAEAETRAAQMLARVDANGDGLIQPDEMQPRGGDMAARLFDRADTDSNGTISEAEFTAMQERMANWRDNRGGRDGAHGMRDGHGGKGPRG